MPATNPDGPGYRRRVVDGELDLLLGELPAISIEGARAVGKMWTARRRALFEPLVTLNVRVYAALLGP